MNHQVSEEVPANSVGTGAAVSLPPAVEPPGITALQRKRFKRKKISEEYLAESGGKVIDQLKKIANSGEGGVVTFENGEKKTIAPESADKLVQLYKNLNASNRVKMIKNVNSSSGGLERIATFAASNSPA